MLGVTDDDPPEQSLPLGEGNQPYWLQMSGERVQCFTKKRISFSSIISQHTRVEGHTRIFPKVKFPILLAHWRILKQNIHRIGQSCPVLVGRC